LYGFDSTNERDDVSNLISRPPRSRRAKIKKNLKIYGESRTIIEDLLPVDERWIQ
jgi:hypothetical protein